ncbi:MAG: hypothetical protein Q8M03_11440 [Legionella sp.]|nr:hypothetical protein [Legionella sp.]
MHLLPKRNNIVFEKKLSEGRLTDHQEMVLRSEIISDLFMSKFITLDQCLNLTFQEYTIVTIPAIYDLIVYRILSCSMAITLTSEQKNILSFSKVSELILRNHLELVQALNMTYETSQLLDRLPEKVIDLIYGNILNSEHILNLTEKGVLRLQSNNINELIRSEVITVDFALSLSDFHYHLLNLNDYFKLVKDNILPPDIFIKKVNDLNKKNIHLLNFREIREVVHSGELTIAQIIELSPKEFEKLSSASTRSLLEQGILSVAQIMSLREWQSSEEISDLVNHDLLSVSQIFELSREQFIYFTSENIRRLLDLRLISIEQVFVLKESQFKRLQNVSFFNLIVEGMYSITEILSLSATQAHALSKDPSLDLVALRNNYKIEENYVPTVGMGDLGAIEIASKLVSDDYPDREIDLKYQNITNIGAKKIADAIMQNKCRNSLKIDLSFNRIDHFGFDFLIESMKRNTLIIELIIKNQFSQYVNSESKKRSLVHPNPHQVKSIQGCCLRNKLLIKNQGLKFYINKTSKRFGLFKGREANDFPRLEELTMATLMLDENYDGIAMNMMLPEELSNAMNKLPGIRNALIPEEELNILAIPKKVSNISVQELSSSEKLEDEGCSSNFDKKGKPLFFKNKIEDINSNSEAEVALRRAVIKAKSENVAPNIRLDLSAKKAIEFINKIDAKRLNLASLPNIFGLENEHGNNEIAYKAFEEKEQMFYSFMFGEESNRTIDNVKFLLELLSLLEWETEFQETICGVYLISLLPNSEERQNLLLNCLHGSMDIYGLSLRASIGIEKVIMTTELEALIDEYLNNYKLISELNECKDLRNDISDKSDSSEDFLQYDEQITDNDFDFQSEEDDDARAEFFKDEIYSRSPVCNICKPKRSEIDILEAFKSKLLNINSALFHKIIPLTDVYYNFHDFLQFLKEKLGTSLITTYDLLWNNLSEYKYCTSINSVQAPVDFCELYDLINNTIAHKTYNDFGEETQKLIIDKLKSMEDSIYQEITIEAAKDNNHDKLLSYAQLSNFSLLKFAEKDWEAVCNIMCSSLSISQKHRLLSQEYIKTSLCSFNKILNQHKLNSLFVQRKEWVEQSATLNF